MEPDACRIHAGQNFGAESKFISAYFSEKDVKKWGQLELSHITDIQFGHVCCNHKRMLEYRDWILAAPNRFMLWGGDNIDAFRIGSPGSPWENYFAADKQITKFCEVWAPARHRILGYVGGNHERRGIIGFGDLGKLISYLLSIPYSSGQQFINIYFGKHNPFTVDLWHGRGGAITKGAKINMVHNYMKQSDAQLVLVGHLHDPIATFDWKKRRNHVTSRIELIKQGGAMSSSFLEFFGTYGEIAGYSPGDVMMARAVLDATGHWELTLK